MTTAERKEHLQFTWRNIIRVCTEVNTPDAWSFAHTWARSKEGGRHPDLGYNTDNQWCFPDIPLDARIFDPDKQILA
jgi:hypothetical protein